jgi:hypothetical protein
MSINDQKQQSLRKEPFIKKGGSCAFPPQVLVLGMIGYLASPSVWFAVNFHSSSKESPWNLF